MHGLLDVEIVILEVLKSKIAAILINNYLPKAK